MKKMKLFFATIWAIMLTLAAQANAYEPDTRDRGSSEEHTTNQEKLRAKLVSLLVQRDIYGFENAFLYVQQLSDSDVKLLLSMTNNPNLKQMAGTGVSGHE